MPSDRRHIEQALTDGAVPARKALLQALVHEIRAEGRDRVAEWFRVPGGANPKVRGPGAMECPRRDSNSRTRLRRPVLYPLSYGGDAISIVARPTRPAAVAWQHGRRDPGPTPQPIGFALSIRVRGGEAPTLCARRTATLLPSSGDGRG